MKFLRQSTAVTVPVGPFLDKADGLTALAALADQSANGRLVKNGTGGAITAASWAHDGNGHYLVGLSTAHTDTLGRLRLDFGLAGTYCPVWEDWTVLPAAAWDELFGTGVHGIAAAGGASSITFDSTGSTTNDVYNGNYIHISSGTGAGQTRLVTAYVGSTKVATVAPAWTTQPSTDSVYDVIPGGQVRALDAAGNAVATDAKQGTPAALAGGTATLAGMLASMAGGSFATNDDLHAVKAAIPAAAPAVSAIADAICDEVISTGHAVDNSLAKILYGNLNAPVGSIPTSPALPADVTNAVTAVNGHTDSATTGLATGLSAITTNLDAKVSTRSTYAGGAATPTDVTNAVATVDAYTGAAASAILSALSPVDTAVEIAAAVLDAARSSHVASGSVGEALNLVAPTGARQITIHVQDGAGAALEGVEVDIYDAANTAHKAHGLTDSSGNWVIHRDDAVYKVRLVKALYAFSLGTLTVTADATATFVGSAVVPIGIPTSGKCLVYGTTDDGAGEHVTGVVIDFHADAPLGVGSAVLTTTKVSVTSGPSTDHPAWTAGYFEVNLLRGAKVRLSSRLPKLDGLVITVPSTSTAELADLVEAAK